MSDTVYVRKDAEGRVLALSSTPTAGGDPGWSATVSDAPEVLHFIDNFAGADSALRGSDLSFVRVLEDVIDLLIDRSVMRFTDLPLPAQEKLLRRRGHRENRQRLQLLDDDEEI